MGVPFLGRLPIYEPIRVGSDVGIPLMIAEPDSSATHAFAAVASQAAAQVSMRAIRAEIEFKGKIPLVPIR
jgi:ATP-binding protein involved in chromosome partitioning